MAAIRRKCERTENRRQTTATHKRLLSAVLCPLSSVLFLHMADIGNYSFVITADATQGIQVLEQLGQKVQAISNTVSHTLAGPTVTGAFKTLTDGIKSPFN